MKKPLTVIFAILIVVVALYVLRDDSVPAPVTDSDNLNALLTGAPINSIDLSASIPDTVFIPAENVFSPEIEAAEMLDSFSSTQAILFGDYIIVMEFLTNNVVAYNLDGDFVKRFQNEKISQAASVTANSDSLYIYDYGNKVIHSYNTDLINQRSFPFSAPYYTQGSIKINDTHLAYQREDASGFRIGENGSDQLLVVSQIEQPEKPLAELFPRIVPSGKQPGGFNNLMFSINNRSDIVSAYPALPYLFVYRNFKQHRNIVLSSTASNEVDNPGLAPFDPVMGEAVRINNLMDRLYLTENGDILIFSFGQLHHLRLGRNGNYEHGKSYVFMRGDNGHSINSISSIDESQSQPGRFYIISSELLYIIDLP